MRRKERANEGEQLIREEEEERKKSWKIFSDHRDKKQGRNNSSYKIGPFFSL